MSGLLLFRRTIFPVAIRQVLSAYGDEPILMVKATSLASTITIIELTGMAQKIIAATYRPVEVFIIAGAFYLLINFIISRGVVVTENWINPHLRYRKFEKTQMDAKAG
jgi:octopine/nopaline transport system permease protein